MGPGAEGGTLPGARINDVHASWPWNGQHISCFLRIHGAPSGQQETTSLADLADDVEKTLKRLGRVRPRGRGGSRACLGYVPRWKSDINVPASDAASGEHGPWQGLRVASFTRAERIDFLMGIHGAGLQIPLARTLAPQSRGTYYSSSLDSRVVYTILSLRYILLC